jgi:1-aminocyclopropane-1-carboxylate deaminase/D-cysteine desulfhydrase-like pyridoxal-dependent ACC family enzyme
LRGLDPKVSLYFRHTLLHNGVGVRLVVANVDKYRSDENSASSSEGASDKFVRDIDALTPVEERCGLLFKRDDLYRPFEPSFLNGGKLRQVMRLLQDCRRPGVITAASIHSPQIPLVAGAAHHLGLHCVAVVGGTRDTPELEIAKQFGATIKRAASGRHRALFAEVTRLNSALDYQVISYGVVSPAVPLSYFMTQGQQAANLPDELDALVVTCGSGVSTLSILGGLWQFSKHVDELIVVATAPSRREKILNFLQTAQPSLKTFLASVKVTHVDLFGSPGFRYEQRTPYKLCGIALHPLYEGKAFRHVMRQRNCLSKRTLFWIIGADFSAPRTGCHA